ncbi:MAG: GNAT family N-acetyltransferase [Pseudomonadota bacterium]
MTIAFPPMAFAMQTARLALRPWQDSDVPAYRALIAERGEGEPTLEIVRGKIRRQQVQAREAGIALLPAFRRDDGAFVGYCGLTVGRASREEPEIAFELLCRMHGQGLATEAARAVVDAAIATGRARLWATIGAWNAPSFRVVEKLGFQHDHSTSDARGEVVWMTRSLR